MLLSQAVVLVKLAVGRLSIVMGIVSALVHPLVLMISRMTEKVPAAVKEWFGFCKVEVLLAPDNGSPKFQFHV